MSKKIIKDAILVLVLLTLGISAFFIIESQREDGAYVKVTVNGEFVAEYSLSEDAEYILNGGTNVLAIENGYAYMKSADCPKQKCVYSNKISRTGEWIFCSANVVFVFVTGSEDEIFIN